SFTANSLSRSFSFHLPLYYSLLPSFPTRRSSDLALMMTALPPSMPRTSPSGQAMVQAAQPIQCVASICGCCARGPSERHFPFSAAWRACASLLFRFLRWPRTKNSIRTAARMKATMESIKLARFLRPSLILLIRLRLDRWMAKRQSARSRCTRRIQHVSDISAGNWNWKEAFHKGILQSVAHEQGDANMKNGEDHSGITKRPVHDVPELKHLLRAPEEEYLLGEGALLLCHANGTLELPVTRREQAAERGQPGTESRLLQAH